MADKYTSDDILKDLRCLEKVSHTRWIAIPRLSELAADLIENQAKEIESLQEKQTAKPVIIRGMGQRYCPVCKNGNQHGKFCTDCGQRLEQ